MRIAIVEDDPMQLENLRILLNGEDTMQVVGAYNSGEKALEEICEVSPDVLLVDIGLPGMSGVELIDRVTLEMPDVEVMVFTGHAEREIIFAAIKAGASGYILKGVPPREIIEAIQELYNGGAPMSPCIARAVINEFHNTVNIDPFILSAREREILKSIEMGLTYKEIGKSLNLSFHTIHTHIKNIYEKLKSKTRHEALLKARRKGII